MGAELVRLYNDGNVAMLGAKHRRRSAPGREVWPEIWHITGPMLEGVLARGEATWSDDQLLVLSRRRYHEECYVTFSYSPIPDERGQVCGVFCSVHETTERVLWERRLRTLGELGTRTADARSSREAADGIIAALASNSSSSCATSAAGAPRAASTAGAACRSCAARWTARPEPQPAGLGGPPEPRGRGRKPGVRTSRRSTSPGSATAP